MLRITLYDDLGSETRLFPLARAVVFGRDRGRFDRAMAWRFRNDLRGALWGVEILPILLATAVLIGIVATLVIFGGRWIGLIAHTPAVVAGITVVVGEGQLIALARRSYRRRVREALLREQCCPACAHGLAGVNPEGRRVRCPECSAAWNADSIGLAPGQSPPVRVIAGFD